MTVMASNAKTARRLVLDLLIKMDAQAAYSTIVLDAALSGSGLSRQDKAFAAALFYGVVERRITLDYLITGLSERPLERLHPAVLQSLRLGLYQLLYMDAVPERAAVDESVKLTRAAGQPGALGFVNAVLRAFIRAGRQPAAWPSDPLEALSVEYSCPLWLVQKWDREYGRAHTRDILASSVGRPPVMARVNTLRITADALIGRLLAEGIDAQVHPALPDCLALAHTGNIEHTAAYRDGLFHVQDLSSQLCCAAVAPQPGDVVLDLCAAPGGKAFTLAEDMGNTGRLLAFDLHDNRVRLIEQGAERLGLTILEARTGDAKVFDETIPQADRVLCDVPCAGLGVIRRKPEIKYKPPETLDGLPAVQRAILDNAASYVRPGGLLVYSTCSLSLAENDGVADAFLAARPDFEGAPLPLPGGDGADAHKRTLFPDPAGGDGFFIAAFRRL